MISRRLLFPLALILGMTPHAGSQAPLISEAFTVKNDFGYELIGRLKDRILLFRDKYDEYEVQAYDNQLRTSWSRKMDDLDKRNVQILSVIGNKNDFSIVHKLRKRGNFSLRIHKYDAGANLLDTLTLKTFSDRMFTPPDIELISSDDKNCFVAINSSERTKWDITCFRLDNMQVLWDRKVFLEDELFADNITETFVTDDGVLYMVSDNNNKKSRREDHELHILRFSAQGERMFRIPLRNFLTAAARYTYDKANRCLVGAGFYGEKSVDRANGSFFIRLPDGDTAQQVVTYEPFDDKYLSILRGRDVADDTKGIPDLTMRHLVLRQDGGAVLVAERFHEVQRGSASSRGFWRDGMRVVVDFYFDDILLLAVHPDGHLHWKTVLHKKQYSQDEDVFSSFFLMKGKEKLRFMFNDEIKYENTCSEYVLNPAGKFDRNSLLNTVGQGLRLRFIDAVQLSASECLVPSEFRNKMRLVLLRF